MDNDVDVIITTNARLVTFAPQTDKARAWLRRNSASTGAFWTRGGLAIERTPVEDLTAAIRAAGFVTANVIGTPLSRRQISTALELLANRGGS